MRSIVLRLVLQRAYAHSLFRITLYSLLIWGVLFLVYRIFSDEQRYLQVNAQTEALVYRVVRPELASIPVVGAEIRNQNQCEAVLKGVDMQDFVGLVRPSFRATVRYRIRQSQVSVRLEAVDAASSASQSSAGELIVSGARCSLKDNATVVFSLAPADSLTDENRRPLPIAGPMEIGTAFGAPLAPARGIRAHEGYMHGADVSVFGRSILSDRLFPLYDSPISIPAGGTLSTVEFDRDRVSQSETHEDNSNWYGVAEIGDGVFQVSATVETTDLVFTRAGSAGEKETIAVGFFTEVVRDPDLSAFLLWFGLLFFVFQAVAFTFSLRSS